MEQGYQQVPRRVASGFFSLIFFIILCLLLIGGYIPLVLDYQKKAQDLKTLNALIDQKLVQPLRSRQVVLQTQQPVQGSSLIYGNEFFEKVAELSVQGTKYDELFRLTGYPTKDTVDQDIQTKLDATSQPDLRTLIERTEDEKVNLAAKAQTLTKNLTEARADRDQSAKESLAARKQYGAKIDLLQNEKDIIQKKATQDVEEYKRKWAQAHAERKQIFDDGVEAKRKAAAKIAELEATIAKKEKEIADLRRELQDRVEVIPTTLQGQIYKTDLIHKFVIINRGERDGMKAGTNLLVYRKGARGELMPIGKVIVVKVEQVVSRADITEQDDAHPIMPGDLLYLNPPQD